MTPARRRRRPVILGLTGSIGMGKTTAAGMFRRLGVPVYDADAEIHRLLGPPGPGGSCGAGVAAVGAAFPGVVVDGAPGAAASIDRAALGALVFDDAPALARLEAILHPLARAGQRRFLRAMARRRVPLAVLDIPLLFETGGDARCDAVVVVSAPRFLQERRVLSRPGMTRERLAAILARQMDDREKRRRADFVVPTGLGRAATLKDLRAIVTLLRQGGEKGGRNA